MQALRQVVRRAAAFEEAFNECSHDGYLMTNTHDDFCVVDIQLFMNIKCAKWVALLVIELFFC
jgi:hypothetical protein